MVTMKITRLAVAAAVALLCAACSTAPSRHAEAEQAPAASSAPPAGTARIVKSRDGSFTGELVGTPSPDSKFAKLQIGMEMGEIQEILGRTADRSHSYETGKRWIPFYFGSEARRLQALYKGEGCLIFTNGNIWGGAGGDLVQIEFDPSGACYQP
jgi:hypothetical protein